MVCNIIDFYQANDRMIVVCLPELPTRLSGIDERLCSRLMGGLQIELKPPAGSAREVIIDQLADQHGVEHHAEAPHVGLSARVLGVGPQDLGGHVGGTAMLVRQQVIRVVLQHNSILQ